MSGGSRALLVVTVAYKNGAEVNEFVDAIPKRCGEMLIEAAVCDNSPDPGGALVTPRIDLLVERPDNPGYLGGGLAAIDLFIAERRVPPDWIILTNTDVEVDWCSVARTLADFHDAKTPEVVAPRITEAGLEMNPHQRSIRTVGRRAIDRALTSTRVLGLLYLTVNWMRLRLRALALKRRGIGDVPAAGSVMYAPYGAMVIFSGAFIALGTLPDDVPLFAEEFAIAKAAEIVDAPIRFEPRIHVIHAGHVTTGNLVSLKRAKRMQVAFRYIWEREGQKRRASR